MATRPSSNTLRTPVAHFPQHRAHPMTPPWIVSAWPTVLWQADAAPELHFVHLGTHVLGSTDNEGVCVGQTLWGESSDARSAGVAWDWVQLQQGVVAMADPMGLVTNLRLLNARGEALAPFELAVHLNGIVHGLPWQNEVCRALGQGAN
jgi:hypothetical protein